MKKASWSLFTYPVMDIKAAEALLNRRAAEGWTLDRVYLGTFARFVPADTRWAWCVDWSRPGYSESPERTVNFNSFIGKEDFSCAGLLDLTGKMRTPSSAGCATSWRTAVRMISARNLWGA